MPLEFSASEGDALEGYFSTSSLSTHFASKLDHPLTYRTEVGNGGVTSLLIGTLQIEVSVDSTAILYIWDYIRNHDGKLVPSLLQVRKREWCDSVVMFH